MLQKIIAKTWLNSKVVDNIIGLIEEWNTIPFIARYRKEMTEGASDEQLRDFEEIYNYQKNLEERKADILRLMLEKEVLTPELEKAIKAAETLSELEDIYRPFKEKKNTRATKAIAKWLQPLADILLTSSLEKDEFEKKAAEFIIDSGDEKTSVTNMQEAIQWAMDIVAEIVADNPELRTYIKETQKNKSQLISKATKTFDEKWVYWIYKEYTKTLSQMPSYAYLAICRAEKDKQLSVKLNFGEEPINAEANKIFIATDAKSSKDYLIDAIVDGIKRLLLPSVEREFRSDKKELSDREAIEVFGKNVQEMLLLAPVKWKTIIWFDPAFRTWCKLAVIDPTGKFLYNTVIYPTEPQNKVLESEKTIIDIIKKYKVDLICIWNWTASRESEKFMADTIAKHKLDCKFLIVSEAWASVYSASKLADKEYPGLDVTVRWAINIAQRVQDPLSTYVKIDPKSLGVGQYQHDVDQKLLKEKLDNKIADTVNSVWVDLNTASPAILQHIAGLSSKIAENVIAYREENGSFKSRTELKKVKWLWPKAYEQCAWFLRISAAKDALDATWIHPETYKVTYDILENEYNTKKKDLKLPYICNSNLDISNLANKYEIGEQTLHDIIAELANPGLDPRDSFDENSFKSDILSISDLKEGMELTWVVRNVVDFWAFIDVGLKNDGLVHKSQMSDTYVTDPFQIVNIGQRVTAKVIWIDKERQRVQLSMKTWRQEKNSQTSKPKSWSRPTNTSSQNKPIINKVADNTNSATTDSKLAGNISRS